MLTELCVALRENYSYVHPAAENINLIFNIICNGGCMCLIVIYQTELQRTEFNMNFKYQISTNSE
jgi:hypothetical protein